MTISMIYFNTDVLTTDIRNIKAFRECKFCLNEILKKNIQFRNINQWIIDIPWKENNMISNETTNDLPNDAENNLR